LFAVRDGLLVFSVQRVQPAECVESSGLP
jgi:hypothetical protein